jgi:hypothetical protein
LSLDDLTNLILDQDTVRDEIDASAWSSILERSGQLYVKPPSQRIGAELKKIGTALASRSAR